MRADRLLGILLTLDENRKVTARELAEKFEVTVRTIYRDISVIPRDFPIRAEDGPNGGYSLMPGYRLPPLPFSKKDILALTLMGSVAGQKLGLIEGENFKKAFRKLFASLPHLFSENAKSIANKILIDVEPWKIPPKVPRVLEKITEALTTTKTITFQYAKAGRKVEAQEVDPYGLCHRSGFWYLVGFSRKRKAIRLFRADRFEKLVVTGEPFTPDPQFDLEHFWTKQLPKEYENKGAAVKIIFDKSVVNEIKKTKWGAGKTRKLQDGRLELTFKTFDTERLVSFVLSFGPKALLVEPKSLKEKIKKSLREASEIYK